ncbi:hypothetical protein ACFVYP_31215 [Kitasatospora sp. NPDC058201]|uniref:hypothetical protein n=1 Tax=Streptomycetaceae TaxID=2062 RepID=UPI002E772F1C|nr:hypothetical protein [Streptomyces sp. BE303]MED7952169.1 hypothetical protein [Streptomyces sp. BE303]
MTGLAVLVLWIVLVVWALERNHRRLAGPPPSRNGTAGVRDRDAERVRAELRAAADRADQAEQRPFP